MAPGASGADAEPGDTTSASAKNVNSACRLGFENTARASLGYAALERKRFAIVGRHRAGSAGSRRARQFECEDGSALGGRFDVDGSSVSGGDMLDDVEAEPQPVRGHAPT